LTASPLTLHITERLRELALQPPDAQTLGKALRLLAKWRSALVSNTLVQHSGTRILSGPFAGMNYGVGASEGSQSARLIGCYEASLAPVIEAIVASQPVLIMDVGCAEGYYAVGLARRLPATRILARDASEKAKALCAALAALNGVADRIEMGGLVTHADFDIARSADTVVICDIEGAETVLLDPAAAPGLTHARILVECHDCITPGISTTLTARFAPTHHVQRIDRVLDGSALPAWTEELSDLDRLLALWEWRLGPTPWLLMTPR
jgi:hypothetical protein